MNKVFCIGELLIDFIGKDIGKGLEKGNNFEKKAGGAPANVAAAVSKLGGESYFLGQVGNIVKVYDEEFDEEITYTIVGSTEVDLAQNKISNESPVGAALLGKKKNQEVEVKTPAGTDRPPPRAAQTPTTAHSSRTLVAPSHRAAAAAQVPV